MALVAPPLAAALLAVGALCLGACGSEEVAATPTEEEIAVLTETFLVEAALQDFSGPAKDTLALRYYAQLYDAYGIDADYLIELRGRYNADVQLWQTLADSAQARIERHQTDPVRLLNPTLE